MKRLAVAVLLLLAAPFATEAQHRAKIPRIGVLSPQHATESPAVQREPFERGLRELGWSPGSTIAIEYRYAEGTPERLPDLAAELVKLNVDVIVARGPHAVRGAQAVTNAIPIVMAAVPDPVRHGFVKSLARPGGNITGLAFLVEDLGAKHLELLKETIPGVTRVAVLMNSAMAADQDRHAMPGIEAAARSMGLQLETFQVSKPGDITHAFTAMARGRVGAVLVRADPNVLEPNRARVVDLALSHRLPAMYPWRLYVDAGGFMSYATSIPAFHYKAAGYVDRILKGIKPGELPVEQPTKFELVINLKTAKVLGLTIPPSVLLRADEIIE